LKTSIRLRSPVKLHGGKSYLAAKFVAMFPRHETYVEPFAGGLSVLLNKPPTRTEVAGDLNGDLVHFYAVLRDRPQELSDRLRSVAYTAESFAWAFEASQDADPIESAARFLVKNRFSRGGLGKDFAWSDRLRGGQPGDANAWSTILEELPAIAARLRRVELHQGKALDLIEKFDSPRSLIYCDPPYMQITRTAHNVYRHEMSDEDHQVLLDALQDVRGMVLLSGYACPLYEHSLKSWERHEFEMPNNAGQTRVKTRRVEVLWMNPACDRFELQG
jgi:DNA adenine methylase